MWISIGGKALNNKEFGAKIRQLRERSGLTREQFCDDEIELTSRQLMRIESGESKPTLSKITFIAKRLGMTLYQLMPDYVELPARYTKLKYDMLRIPTYEQPELVEKRNAMLTEIYDAFYNQLPEEEKVAIDAFQSTIDVLETRSAHFGKDIVDEYFMQIRQKEVYTVNDLLIIRLYIGQAKYWQQEEHLPEFLELLEELIAQKELLASSDLFVLRDVLLMALGTLGTINQFESFPKLFSALDEIMTMSQDFQKKPIVSMLRWKYELYYRKDRELAERWYEEASRFAHLMGNRYLVERLEKDWKEDFL